MQRDVITVSAARVLLATDGSKDARAATGYLKDLSPSGCSTMRGARW